MKNYFHLFITMVIFVGCTNDIIHEEVDVHMDADVDEAPVETKAPTGANVYFYRVIPDKTTVTAGDGLQVDYYLGCAWSNGVPGKVSRSRELTAWLVDINHKDWEKAGWEKAKRDKKAILLRETTSGVAIADTWAGPYSVSCPIPYNIPPGNWQFVMELTIRPMDAAYESDRNDPNLSYPPIIINVR